MEMSTNAMVAGAQGAGQLEVLTRAASEMQAMVALAQKFPRDEAVARANIARRCKDPWMAENGVYRYSIKGKDIRGVSIVLATEMAEQWGNMLSGIHQLDDQPADMTLRAFAWDMERNRMRQRSWIMPKRQLRAGGEWKDITDDRDIRLAANNTGSREERNCICKVMPGSVVQAALELCETTHHLVIERDSKPVDLDALAGAFGAIGIPRAELEQLLGQRLEQLAREKISDLRGLHTAAKNGDVTPGHLREVLEGMRAEPKGETFTASADKNRGHGATRPATERPAAPEPEKPEPKPEPVEKPAAPKPETPEPESETKPAEPETVQAESETPADPEEMPSTCNMNDFTEAERRTVQTWGAAHGAKNQKALDVLLARGSKDEILEQATAWLQDYQAKKAQKAAPTPAAEIDW